MNTVNKEPKTVDIVWTFPEGKTAVSFSLTYRGQTKALDERDVVTEAAFNKLSAKGLCKKLSASKPTAAA